jgi:hypothetical protein
MLIGKVLTHLQNQNPAGMAIRPGLETSSIRDGSPAAIPVRLSPRPELGLRAHNEALRI